MRDSSAPPLTDARGGGEENAIIVYQLNRRRARGALSRFPHCHDRMWEGPPWPGLVSRGWGGRNLIQGFAWGAPPLPPPCPPLFCLFFFVSSLQQRCKQRSLCAGGAEEIVLKILEAANFLLCQCNVQIRDSFSEPKCEVFLFIFFAVAMPCTATKLSLH